MGETEIRIRGLLGMFIVLQGLTGPLLDHQSKINKPMLGPYDLSVLSDYERPEIESKLQGLEEQCLALQHNLRGTLRDIYRSTDPSRNQWLAQLLHLRARLTSLRRRIRSALRRPTRQKLEKFLLRHHNSCPDLTELTKTQHIDDDFMQKFLSRNESLNFRDIHKRLFNDEYKFSELVNTFKSFSKEGSQNVDSSDEELVIGEDFNENEGSRSAILPSTVNNHSVVPASQENEGSRSAILPSTVNNHSVVPASQGNIEDDSDDDGSSQQFPGISERIRQFNNRPQAEDQSHSNAPSTVDQNRFLKQNVQESMISSTCASSAPDFSGSSSVYVTDINAVICTTLIVTCGTLNFFL